MKRSNLSIQYWYGRYYVQYVGTEVRMRIIFVVEGANIYSLGLSLFQHEGERVILL